MLTSQVCSAALRLIIDPRVLRVKVANRCMANSVVYVLTGNIYYKIAAGSVIG